MTHHSLIILCTLLITISPCFHGISAVDYQVTNLALDTPGGKRLSEIVGIQGAKELMGQANEYIWSTILQQNNPETRKPIDYVLLFIDKSKSYRSWSENNIINISANNISEKKEDVKSDFASDIYYHMTLVLAWGEEGKSPQQLLEGIGYFTIIKVKLIEDGFPKPGDGDTWDQDSEVTSGFLEYCDEGIPGIVVKLNEKLKAPYDASFFKDITGKSVEELWKDYKSKHGSN